MKFFMTTSVMAFLILLDLLLDSWGLPLGLSIYGAGYFYFAYGSSYGLISAVLAGVAIDAAYNRPFALSAWIFFAALLILVRIVERGGRQFFFFVAGAAAAGAFTALCNMAAAKIFSAPLPGPDPASILLFYSGAAAVNIILMILVFDFFGFRGGLPCCIREEYAYRKRGRRTVSRSKINNLRSSRQ